MCHFRRVLRLAIASLLVSLAPAHAAPLPVSRPENIQLYQYCLTTLGFYAGPMDGVPTPQTQTAWEQATQHYATLNGFSAADKPIWAQLSVMQTCAHQMMVYLLLQEQYTSLTPPRPKPSLTPVNQQMVDEGARILKRLEHKDKR